jgi:hypothetical protein
MLATVLCTSPDTVASCCCVPAKAMRWLHTVTNNSQHRLLCLVVLCTTGSAVLLRTCKAHALVGACRCAPG